MSKVNLFIVGAPKCATTSLHKYLCSHECVYMSTPKEVNFFSKDELQQQGLYYSDFSVNNITEYENLFSGTASFKVVGESSVSYFSYGRVARKIANYNPNAKIIIVLRNPIDRAYSHYLMDKRLGYCDYDFEYVFRNESLLPNLYYQYFTISLYYKHVKSYLDVFGNDSVLILFDSEFKIDAAETMSRVSSFLNIDNCSFDVNRNTHNAYKEPSNKLFAKAYQSHMMRLLFKRVIPKKVENIIKPLIFKKANKPILQADTINELKDYFYKDVERLSELLDRDLLSEWGFK